MILSRKAKAVILAVLALFPLLAPAGTPEAGERERWRVWAGLDLFPSVLAADQDIREKAGPDGTLLLLLLCRDNCPQAEEMARDLAEIKAIRDIPVTVKTAVPSELARHAGNPPAGIFLTRRFPDQLADIQAFARGHHRILFSPFAGDLEKGVCAGIAISDRILPQVNLSALKASEIRLKSFFLRIAKAHE